jgi:formiminotetrahydrofolate cyclodeaminase
MVASMSRGKKAYLQHEPELSVAIARLTPLREELKAAIDADAEAYDAVMKAYKQSKTDAANADTLIDTSLKLATGVPLNVAEKAHEVGAIAQSLEPISNPNMKSDLTTALALARAAITGALANVEINLASLKDAAFIAEVRRRVQALTA